MADDPNNPTTPTPEEQTPDPTAEPRVPISEEVPDSTTPAAEEAAVLNPVTRVFAVFTNPGDAMRGVKLKGGWLMPFLFLVICVVIFAAIGGSTMTEFAMDQMQDRFEQMVIEGKLSQEQADQIYEQQANSGMIGLFMYINPIIGSLLIKLVMAALLLLAGNVFMGGNEKFRRYWSLAWYAGVIGALHVALYGILIGITNDPHGGYLGLAVLTKAAPDTTLHKIAQVGNIFLIWEAIVAGIGLSVFTRKTVGQGILWGLVVYVGIGLLTSLLFGQPVI